MRSILKKGSAYGFKSMTTTVRFNAGSHHDVKSHDSHDAHHEHDSHAVEIKPDQPFWPNDICENDYKAFEHLFHNPATKESPYALHNLVANSSLYDYFLRIIIDMILALHPKVSSSSYKRTLLRERPSTLQISSDHPKFMKTPCSFISPDNWQMHIDSNVQVKLLSVFSLWASCTNLCG